MRVLYITNGMASTLNSSFELSRRLLAAGHEVVYASPADIVDQVEAQGLRCTRLLADQPFQVEAGRAIPISRPLAWLRSLTRRRSIRRRSIANDEIERIVGDLAPDLLLIDIEMHFAVIATAASRIPTLLPIVWFSVFRRAGLPPMHTTLMPDGSRRRLRIALSWWRLRFATVNGELQDRVRRAVRGEIFRPVTYDTFDVDDLRAVAKARGFAIGRETDRSHWLRPYVYSHLPLLCFNAWEMELPQERWPTVHYVGPMVRLDRREVLVDPDSAERWRQFKQRRRLAGSERPLVYCSLGSFWSMDRQFLRRVIDVFERRPEWDLVLALGGKLEIGALEPVPENALVLDYAPQVEVLRGAACAITHGGVTTINECIELGVPMLVYSTQHVDQNGCAARVGFHRLGVVADKDRDDVEAMERKLEQALTDPTIRRNVEAMRASFQRYKQPDAAVDVIEKAYRESARD